MAGKTPKTPKTPLRVTQDQRSDLKQLSGSANRSEADRARAILLSLGGWTSAEIGAAFGRRKLGEQKVPEGARGHGSRLALGLHGRGTFGDRTA